MVLRTVATALLAFVVVPAVPAAAEQTAPQKLFRKRLLADDGVSRDIKRTLRHGGFVDRNIRFGDVTGDTKSDALVLVNDGGAAGRIALYVYSSHRTNSTHGGQGGELRIVYKNQHLYRARASLRAPSDERPNGAVVFRKPFWDPGDTVDDPAGWNVVELRWRTRRTRFRIADTQVIDNVRKRFCSETGDYCIQTLKDKKGATYLGLSSLGFSGRYTLCVTTPAGKTDCRQFTLRRSGDGFISSVRWAANFPDEGRGRYGVVWKLGTQKLGRELGFRRP